MAKSDLAHLVETEFDSVEREKGFEPSASSLARKRSTAELLAPACVIYQIILQQSSSDEAFDKKVGKR